MNITIPFSKNILFKSKIAEICSISLEQDVSINEKELLGDFIVSGDYKNLDVNVDTTPFSYVVPFSVSLEEDIDLDTLKYEIADFKYNIVDEDTLNVEISFHVEADKIIKDRDIFEKVEEEIPAVIPYEECVDEQDTLDVKEEIREAEEDLVGEDDKKSVSLITSHDLEEDYITYHIHIVKINETIDSISTEYKIDKDELMELNDVKDVNMGDKLIIPINIITKNE